MTTTVNLGLNAPHLTVRLWHGRPWTSDTAIQRRAVGGGPLVWPRAPRIEFGNGTFLACSLTGDSLSAMASGSLSAAQVDGIIDHGDRTVTLVDPVTGRVYASGRWDARRGAGSGGVGLVPTDGQAVVIISDTVVPVGGGGGGGPVSWGDITSKPTEFPPASHHHAITDVEGLADALAALEGSIDDTEIAAALGGE